MFIYRSFPLRRYGIWNNMVRDGTGCCDLKGRRPSGRMHTASLPPPRPGLVGLWDSAGKDAGVGCHFFLQGIFPTQGSTPGLLHCRQILHCLSRQGSPKMLLAQAAAAECGRGQRSLLFLSLSGLRPASSVSRRGCFPAANSI